jgi:hypothetical protein
MGWMQARDGRDQPGRRAVCVEQPLNSLPKMRQDMDMGRALISCTMGGHEQSKSSRSGNPDGGPEPGYRVVWMDGMGWIGCNPNPAPFRSRILLQSAMHCRASSCWQQVRVCPSIPPVLAFCMSCLVLS